MAKKVVFERYERLDLFTESFKRPVNVVFKSRESDLSSHDTGNPEWYGTKNFEEAMKLFNNGWTEKADEIRKEFVQFERAEQKDVSYQKKRPATSVVGFAPHVPNAILGLPNSMIYTERTPMKEKVVRIIYNMTMNSNTDANDILNAGLAVLKIVNSLERKGYRVRVDVLPKCSEGNTENAVCMVCIKDWRQPIDIKKVAFPMAHPSMFRRLGFRWMETCPITDNGFKWGYGHSFEKADEVKKILKECGAFGDNDYFVNVPIAKKAGFDPKKTAEAIGIKSL